MHPAKITSVRFCYLLGIVAALTSLACTSDLRTSLSAVVEKPSNPVTDPIGSTNMDAGNGPGTGGGAEPCTADNSCDAPEDTPDIRPPDGDAPDGSPPDEDAPDGGAQGKDTPGSGAPGENSPDSGTPDAMAPLDECPEDPAKTQPGLCGCGMPDDGPDSDSDGVLDCVDLCPSDENKVEPGSCGCGVSDETDDEGVAQCVNLANALLHRYSFNGSGAVVVDSAGAADAVVINQSLTGSGQLSLQGGDSDQYVDLPDDLLLGLTDVSFEIWFTWHGGPTWQRLFDFGQSSLGQEQGEGTSYLALVPFTTSAFSLGGAMLLYKPVDEEEVRVAGATAIVPDEPTQLAVVFDDTQNTISLYLNGALEGSLTTQGSLADVSAANHWLGRSQFTADVELDAELDEFRIHAKALTAEQIRFSVLAGPNPAFLAEQ